MIDGAAVRVSLVCFSRPDDGSAPERRLDGELVDAVHADLTAKRGGSGVDLTGVQRLYRNLGVAFTGDTKGGAFDVSGERAREWLREPANPNGRPNSDVLGPWMNGMDVTRRPADKWIVDFGWSMVREEAALYEAPFQHAKEHVYPMRQRNRRDSYRTYWWRHAEPRQGMWKALDGRSRCIATPTVAKHRLFAWLDARVCPDHQLIVIARDDDTTFGILHSRFHEAWSLRLGTSLEDRPRYTPTTTFETFPFPDGLSPNIPASDYADDPRAAAIADAVRWLVELRGRWLNPPEWVEWVDEPTPGYPKRPVPRDEAAAKQLKKRTLPTSTTPARNGSPTPTPSSTPPSRQPTAGPSTSPATRRCKNCWRSIQDMEAGSDYEQQQPRFAGIWPEFCGFRQITADYQEGGSLRSRMIAYRVRILGGTARRDSNPRHERPVGRSALPAETYTPHRDCTGVHYRKVRNPTLRHIEASGGRPAVP